MHGAERKALVAEVQDAVHLIYTFTHRDSPSPSPCPHPQEFSIGVIKVASILPNLFYVPGPLQIVLMQQQMWGATTPEASKPVPEGKSLRWGRVPYAQPLCAS